MIDIIVHLPANQPMNGISRNTVIFLSGILGFLGGILSAFGIHYLETRQSRKKLRRSIYIEVSTPKEVINEIHSDIENSSHKDMRDRLEEPLHSQIPMQIYQANLQNLGLLSEEELSEVIPYYNTAMVAQEQLKEGRITEEFFENTIPILKRKRDNAERELQNKM